MLNRMLIPFTRNEIRALLELHINRFGVIPTNDV